MRAFCTSHITDEYLDLLQEHMEVRCGGNPAQRIYLTKEELIEALQGVDILIVSYEKIDEEVIRRCPDLKLIASERDGPEENVDIAAATRAGIPVVHSLGRCIKPVAEHTFMLMLALNRRLLFSSRCVREGWWDTQKPEQFKKLLMVTEHGLGLLDGKTLGIAGLGRNGREIARRALAFGMKVVGYDPYVDPKAMAEMGIETAGLDEVMAAADFFCVMARVTPETVGMIGAREISLMKPTACFINTARSALVDEDALFNALKENRIRAAALDVYSEEPLPQDSRWFEIEEDRLILTPHQGGLCVERDAIHSEELTRYILQYLEGEIPASVMDRSVVQSPGFQDRGGKLLGIERT
ncbi:MAG: NAD(P)-dependent oxidoreductase [Oscillospiraceae bacterium]